MSKAAYNEFSVVKIISRNRDIKVNTHEKTIQIVANSTNIGNGTYGKIDYLTKVHGYVVIKVNAINKNAKHLVITEEEPNYIPNKRNKINLSNMVKHYIKKVN